MISVIIPTHNRAGYLEKAMRSVFVQTRPPDELLIVDDGSTDDTRPLVAALAEEAGFPVHYLYQENRGAAAARNLGITRARGDLLCFLDSDDQWDPRKLEVQERALRAAPDHLIAHTLELWFRRGRRVNQKKKHRPPGGDIFPACLRMCVVGMSTVMARRELFDRYGLFDESLVCCEDYDLWLRVAWREPFLLVAQPLTIKDGGRPDQLSVIHRQGMDRYRIRSLRGLLDSGVLDPGQRAAAVAELARKCRIYGQGCLKHGREEEGRRYLDLITRYSAPWPGGGQQ